MKIEIPKRIDEVRADSIGIGQCFLYDEELHIRTNGSFSNRDSSFPIRIVKLSDGAEDGLPIDKGVLPMKMKCVKDS